MESSNSKSQRFEKLWAYHKEADGILHTRTAAFIVAQAMIVGAFATIFSGSENLYKNTSSFVLCIIGLSLSFLWIRANSGLMKGLAFLKNKICIIDDDYKAYLEICRESYRVDKILPFGIISQKNLMPYLLPSCFVFMWIVLASIVVARANNVSIYIYIIDKFHWLFS